MAVKASWCVYISTNSVVIVFQNSVLRFTDDADSSKAYQEWFKDDISKFYTE